MSNESERDPGAQEPDLEQVGPDTHRLRDYAKFKHALAQTVRSICNLAHEARNEKVRSEGQAVMTKLAEDRFTLAVVGQFKRGKSSLMNAIIGRDLLPTGVLPLTSAITILKYGPTEKLTIQRDGSILPEQPPVTMLAAYVTEQGNPGNQRKVKAAILEEPIPFLRHGLEFVDTPGVGSAIVANTETTYSFLPQCDAVIFVTGMDSPLTEAEMDFLRCTRQFAQKMFFVINKTDLLDGSEREKALAFISDRLRTEMRSDSVRTFPLSSRLAMAAKVSGDTAAYAASGLKDFEEALGAFLSQERAEAFLASVRAKAVRLAEELDAGGLAVASATKCRRIRSRLQTLHRTVSSGTAPEGPIPGQGGRPGPVEEGRPGEPPVNWPVALRTRGCPVCARLADAAFAFYAHWQYALVADEAAQDSFAAEMGFCPLHTWQFLAVSSPQGTSAGFARLAERCAKQLSQFSAAPEAAVGNLASLASRREQCAVCRRIGAVEKDTVCGLAAFLATPGGLRAYRDSQGVCVRHLGLLAAAVPSGDVVRQLLQHASHRFEEASEDMQNYAMKHDGIRRWLQNENEKDAYLRTIVHLVGEKAACALWREDAEI